MKQLLLFPKLQKFIVVKPMPFDIGPIPFPRGMGNVIEPGFYLKEDLEKCPKLKPYVKPYDA